MNRYARSIFYFGNDFKVLRIYLVRIKLKHFLNRAFYVRKVLFRMPSANIKFYTA